jgi:hypothetical protein
MNTSRQTLKQRAYSQLKEFLIIALYLWVVFGLMEFHKSMILAEHHIDFAYHGFALINALALAKVMLVAKDLHLGDQFNEAPLIYPTMLKSALFTIVLACFKILEVAAVSLYRREPFQQSIGELGGGTWKGMLTLTLLVFALLVPFVGFGELQRALGEDKLKKLFFYPRPLESDQPRKSRFPG